MDDGSDPPVENVVARHADRLSLSYRRLQGEGPALARNRGLCQARGEFVAFTDDDCEPDPRWLEALDREFQQHSAAGLGGRTEAASDQTIYGDASQMLISFLYGYGSSGPAELRFFCSNNLAFPRQPLTEMGGFDEVAFPRAAAEDREICGRWLEHAELRYVPDALVVHRQNLNFRSFCSQHFRYGRGAFLLRSKRRRLGQTPMPLQLHPFFEKMLTFPFSRERFPKAAVLSLLISLSQVAHAAGYFFEQWSRPSSVPGSEPDRIR